MLAEFVDIWYDPLFEEASSEDQGHVGVVVCPAEDDTSTDTKDGPHIVTGTAEIHDERETLKIHYWSTKAFGNKNNPGTFP